MTPRRASGQLKPPPPPKSTAELAHEVAEVVAEVVALHPELTEKEPTALVLMATCPAPTASAQAALLPACPSLASGSSGPAPSGLAETPERPSVFTDLRALLARGAATEADWVEGSGDVLARHRGHVLFGPAKSMKSLLAQALALEMVRTGKVVVVYLDWENGEGDYFDRLESMGAKAGDAELDAFKLWHFPNGAALDTRAGGAAVLAVLDEVQAGYPDRHLVAVFDTYGRAVEGAEDASDTTRAFYRHTGLGLKSRGYTWLRQDHSGKDEARGARGSSAKMDDVDLAWEVRPNPAGTVLTLRRKVSRMPWVPEAVRFGILADPLRFQRTGGDLDDDVREMVNLLDHLGVPVGASQREVKDAIKVSGERGKRTACIGPAQAYRLRTAGGTP